MLISCTDFQFSDSDSDVEITAIRCLQAPGVRQDFTLKTINNEDIEPPDVSIQSYRFDKGKGVVIKPGDTVELRDNSNQRAGDMQSGDFLRVKRIIKNLETEEVRLRGYRMRRTKYLHQIFKCKYS